MAFISPDRNELVSIVARNAFIIFGVGCVPDFFVGMHSTNNFCILGYDAFDEYHRNRFFVLVMTLSSLVLSLQLL